MVTSRRPDPLYGNASAASARVCVHDFGPQAFANWAGLGGGPKLFHELHDPGIGRHAQLLVQPFGVLPGVV